MIWALDYDVVDDLEMEGTGFAKHVLSNWPVYHAPLLKIDVVYGTQSDPDRDQEDDPDLAIFLKGRETVDTSEVAHAQSALHILNMQLPPREAPPRALPDDMMREVASYLPQPAGGYDLLSRDALRVASAAKRSRR